MRSNFRNISNVLQEGVDSDGGYLVPEEYDSRLIDVLEEENIMRSLATTITTSGQHKINIAATKPAAAWIEEGGALSFGDATFDQIYLDAYKLHVAIKVTEELLYDNAFNLENYIITQFGKLLQGADCNFRFEHPQRPRHKLCRNRKVYRQRSFHHCRNKARHRLSQRLGQAEIRCRLDCARLFIQSLTGTREHVGTANSYFSIYFTYFYISYFSYKICTKIGFLVFYVFQALKIQSFLEQVRSVGISSESLQAAFFMP